VHDAHDRVGCATSARCTATATDCADRPLCHKGMAVDWSLPEGEGLHILERTANDTSTCMRGTVPHPVPIRDREWGLRLRDHACVYLDKHSGGCPGV
jgi:hypothetical protein